MERLLVDSGRVNVDKIVYSVNVVVVDTRKGILEAAIVVFGRYGFRQASMEHLAEQASLSRQGVYRYFQTKEQLFAACVKDFHEAALESGAEAARAARAAGEDPAEVLIAQLAGRFGTILARIGISAHADELMDENHRQCGAINAEYGERFADQLASTIQVERRAGRLAADGTSAPQLARYLIAAARGIKSAVPTPPAAEFQRDLGRMVRLLVSGVQGATATKARSR